MAQGGKGGGAANDVNKILGKVNQDDVLVGTEGVDAIFGRGGDDQLFGEGGDDELDGGEGNDFLSGGAGDDTLLGGAGDDLLSGDAGADLLDGGEGVDTASYNGSQAGVSVSLAGGLASGGHAEGDTLVSIESLTGSSHADLLVGDDGTNVLDGAGGDDRLFGGAGNDGLLGGDGRDTLEGGAGDDTLQGGAGDDVLNGGVADNLDSSLDSGSDILDGGTGTDRISYEGATAGVIVDLGAGTAADGSVNGDTLISIEDVDGTNFADTLIGDAGDNVLQGRGGGDTLIGGGGNDALLGSTADDVLDGGEGDDLLSGLRDGNDTMTGGAGADIFALVSGSDISIGYPPHPDPAPRFVTTITDFEPGVDKVVIEGEPFDVLAAAEDLPGGGVMIRYFLENEWAVVLEGVTTADLSAGDFQFANGPGVFGSNGSGTYLGTDGADIYFGLGGDDMLFGGAGSDRLDGGSGNDLLNGAAEGETSTGNETLFGGAGNDTLIGGIGGDSLDGGDGDDLLSIGTLGTHVATGGTGADTFQFVTAIGVGPAPDLDPDPANLTTITDFVSGEDVVEFGRDAFDVLGTAEQRGDDVLIVYEAERGVLLLDTQITDLSGDDFVFLV